MAFGFLIGAGVGCSEPGSSDSDPPRSAATAPASTVELQLAALRALEEATRAATDFSAMEPWSQRSGADPWAIEPLGAGRFVALLRGEDALVLLDAGANELGRVDAPPRPTGLAVDAAGAIWVVGEGGPSLGRYRLDEHGTLVADGTFVLHGHHALRDVAGGDHGWIYVADRHRGRIDAARVRGADRIEVEPVTACAGAIRLLRRDAYLVGACLLEHAAVVVPLGPDGRARTEQMIRIEHDGPIWSIAAAVDDDGLLLALGGVEDHPLDRSDGSFGFIDSFVYVVSVSGADALRVERRAAIDVSTRGVVTPKALQLVADDGGWRLTVSGYGADRLVTMSLDARGVPTRHEQARTLVAGISDFVGSTESGLAADPLLDAWVRWEATEVEVHPVGGDDSRSLDERIGEALVFTHLMAPFNDNRGRASRFTCETCHFEGTVDGRTHHTGRADVHATTKTLRGLFENRPHFSRALDRTMTRMVHNEFRVANRASVRDPARYSGWFAIDVHDVPWVAHLGVHQKRLEPAQLRRALMAFLMTFAPELNPATSGRTRFDALEREGAALFARHCEQCHQARRVADDPATRVPEPGWEADVLGLGRIVWGSPQRYLTRVTPYVHPDGPRVPSLRRLWVKRPYLTNGSAPTVDAVLQRVVVGDAFAHDGEPAPGSRRLTPDEREALATFLDLL